MLLCRWTYFHGNGTLVRLRESFSLSVCILVISFFLFLVGGYKAFWLIWVYNCNWLFKCSGMVSPLWVCSIRAWSWIFLSSWNCVCGYHCWVYIHFYGPFSSFILFYISIIVFFFTSFHVRITGFLWAVVHTGTSTGKGHRKTNNHIRCSISSRESEHFVIIMMGMRYCSFRELSLELFC